MKYRICSGHGCRLVTVKTSDGSEIEDCPKCMEFVREQKINFGCEQPSWEEINNAK